MEGVPTWHPKIRATAGGEGRPFRQGLGNIGKSFVVTAPLVNIFKKGLDKIWTDVFPHLPH